MRLHRCVLIFGLFVPVAGAETTVPAAVSTKWTPTALCEDVQRRWRWLRIGGEFRSRLELPTSLNFEDRHNDADLLLRVRINAAIEAKPWLRFYTEWQDLRAPGWDSPVPASASNRFDLRQAYAEFGATAESGWGIRVGRQPLRYGKGRLVWDPDWSNIGRTFDGIRLTFERRGARVEAFAASVVSGAQGRFDRSDASNMFYGLYGSIDAGPRRLRVEPYLLVKSTARVRSEMGLVAPLDLYSSGVRMEGMAGARWDWETELVAQAGQIGYSPVRAWGGVWSAGWRTGREARRPRLSAVYTFGSGDADPTDGKKRTFDTLFPSTHMRNGATDRIGWANIHDLLGQADFRPSPRWRVSVGGHDFRLVSTKDGLYSPGGAILVRNPRATSSHVGAELFAIGEYAMSNLIQFGAGYAHLFRGQYLRQSGCGSPSQPYVFLTYRFR